MCFSVRAKIPPEFKLFGGNEALPNTETHAGFFFLHSNSVRNFILYKSKLTQRSFLYKIRVELLLYSA